VRGATERKSSLLTSAEVLW